MNVRSTGKLLNVAYGSDNKVALSVIHSHVETHRCIPIKCTCTQLHSICCRYVYYVFLPMYWLRRQHLNSVVFSSLTVTVTSSCSRVLYHGWICVVFRFSFFFFFFFFVICWLYNLFCFPSSLTCSVWLEGLVGSEYSLRFLSIFYVLLMVTSSYFIIVLCSFRTFSFSVCFYLFNNIARLSGGSNNRAVHRLWRSP